MEGWQHLCLSDIAEIVPGFAFKGKDFGSIGIKTIKIKDIISPYVDIQNADCIDISHYDKKKLEKFNLHYGDFIVAMTGATIGKVGIFLHTEPAYINQRVAKILPQKNVDKKFVYYALVQDSFQSFIQNNIDSNSAQENISSTSIGNFPVLLPQLPERQAIAAVLSSLDDKIDLLHRQNKTLEALAQTLFRQWFVEEADEGWDEFSVGDIAVHSKIGVKPNADMGKSFFHYSIPAYDNGKEPTLESGVSIMSNKYRVVKNSILVSKLNPKTPRIWPVRTLPSQDSICSTEFQVVVPKEDVFFEFICCLLSSKEAQEALMMAASGTSGSHQRVKPEDIFAISVKSQSKDQISLFSQQVKPYFDRKFSNQNQIRTLTKLRDTLLPKLMSGDVRVIA